ncbi:ribonuclease R [Paralimibaculum aggregatum]|uniref:Ribonuclease R n=1 Tax=Paralimibaculum aggregatum TaxID=3036245 RepID=A0ABQ6LSA5_9RHOB|nr:ribonuclease R [Limibaculum sp. NKW23]GMG84775.1 ribonuclease R [Limibaculum sp. NKW23]
MSFPSKAEILAWINENPHSVGKREIARAFNLKGADRVVLKQVLRELEQEGAVQRRRRRLGNAGHLPPVTVLVAGEIDAGGDLTARPKDWDSAEAPPEIHYVPRKGDVALAPGDRFLAKLRPVEEPNALRYEARLIKKIGSGPRRMLGIYRAPGKGNREGGRLVSVDKRADREWIIPPGAEAGAQDGELVEAEATETRRMGLPRGRVVERIGDPGAPKQVSLIAIHQHDIPLDFPDAVLAEAEAAALPGAAGREDLRALPLVTIDPADARDHDDAVAALPDDDPANPGGHVVWVAIADVAALVPPGSALDAEARRRGNSTYFPDRVAPMLPERLSADLCSLMPGQDRPCMALRMVLDAEGNKRGHRFCRGVMRSHAALSYEAAQAAADGNPGPEAAPLAGHLGALWAAWRAAWAARSRRQPLDLDLPERRITLNAAGEVTGIPIRERFDAHRLIEEFMILANVAAAETLEAHRRPLLYRVHEEPDPERLEMLRETLEAVGIPLARGQVLRTRDLNRVLESAAGTESQEMVHMQVLRAQQQAYYSPDALGHFGLALPRYAHFTSPIRRYADLVVHRALIAALGLGADGQTAEEAAALRETAEAISRTERRSMEAERDTVDRYVAAYMAEREGAEFEGRISGVGRFGVFVKLAETGADGLVPISTIGQEYFRHDPEAGTLTGERSGRVLAMGMHARVRLVEAVPVTGGLLFELLEATGVAPRRKHPSPSGKARKVERGRIARARNARRKRR